MEMCKSRNDISIRCQTYGPTFTLPFASVSPLPSRAGPSKILSFVALPWQEADATNGLSLLQTCEDAEMSHAMDLCSKHLGAELQRVALAQFGAVAPDVPAVGFCLVGSHCDKGNHMRKPLSGWSGYFSLHAWKLFVVTLLSSCGFFMQNLGLHDVFGGIAVGVETYLGGVHVIATCFSLFGHRTMHILKSISLLHGLR